MRFRLWLSALVLLTALPPARACVNDREIERAEREFRSQYLRPPPAPPPAADPSDQPGHAVPFAVLGFGGILLLGAVASVLSPRGRPRGE